MLAKKREDFFVVQITQREYSTCKALSGGTEMVDVIARILLIRENRLNVTFGHSTCPPRAKILMRHKNVRKVCESIKASACNMIGQLDTLRQGEYEIRDNLGTFGTDGGIVHRSVAQLAQTGYVEICEAVSELFFDDGSSFHLL